MMLELNKLPKSMKDNLHTLSLMTDQKLAEHLAKKGFDILKIQMEIELIKTEMGRRLGV